MCEEALRLDYAKSNINAQGEIYNIYVAIKLKININNL